MKNLDYGWIGNYGEIRLVHDPSIGNLNAKTINFLGFTMQIPISLIM